MTPSFITGQLRPQTMRQEDEQPVLLAAEGELVRGRGVQERPQVALAPEEDAHADAERQHDREGDPEAGRAVDQRQALEVHAEEAGHQVERQEDRGQHGQRAHDVVGAVALLREVHLHRGLGRRFEAAHVREHALDVLEDVARAHAQLLALALLRVVGSARAIPRARRSIRRSRRAGPRRCPRAGAGRCASRAAGASRRAAPRAPNSCSCSSSSCLVRRRRSSR